MTGAESASRPVLSVHDLSVRYGSATAVFNVSLELAPRSVMAVLGPNGAGKTSLARRLAGLVPAVGGTVHLDGLDVTDWPAHRIRRAGLTYLPEGRGIYPTLTVMENLRVAVRWLSSKSEKQAGIERAIELFPVLGKRRSQRAGTMSGGEQQMLSLARGLAVPPKLLIADELTLGLAPIMVDVVFKALETVKESGVAILLIEQFVHRALGLADEVAILRRGTMAWEGEASGSADDVLQRYLGDQEAF